MLHKMSSVWRSNIYGHMVISKSKLINKYKVDIVQTGHVHDYERSWPTYKGKAVKGKSNKTHYIEP